MTQFLLEDAVFRPSPPINLCTFRGLQVPYSGHQGRTCARSYRVTGVVGAIQKTHEAVLPSPDLN